MSKDLRAVIFDMDGLIIESEKVYREGWIYGAKAMNIDLPEELVDRMAGRSPRENTRELVNYTNSKEKVQKIRNWRENYFYEQLINNEVKIKHYFRELIATLKINRVKTAVATSSIKEKAAAIFDQYQLASLFDVIVTGDQVEKVKPDPALYLEAQKRLDMPSQSLLVLEDSVTGARAANSAGLPFIIIPDNSSNSTIKIPDNFKYMITVLDSLESVEKWIYRNKCFDF